MTPFSKIDGFLLEEPSAELYSRMKKIASFHCRRHPHLEGDVLHTAWLKLQKSVGEGKRFNKTYLDKTIACAFIDELRRSRTPNAVSWENLIHEEAIDKEGAPLMQSHRNPQKWMEIKECFERLSPERKKALYLTRVLGHTMREAATILGTSFKSVDNWIARGRKELRECLEWR